MTPCKGIRPSRRSSTFFSEHPHAVALDRWVLVELDAERVLLDRPFSGSLAPHGVARHGAAPPVESPPVHLIGQLHAGDFGADLAGGKLLELLFSGGAGS